jgi:hypothetical protein
MGYKNFYIAIIVRLIIIILLSMIIAFLLFEKQAYLLCLLPLALLPELVGTFNVVSSFSMPNKKNDIH